MEKYTIIEIQNFADELFREWKIQVPDNMLIDRFLVNFENFAKGEKDE